MRMHNRRFTRLTNAFSKKFENHAHMVAIYAVWYNWLRIHKTLRVTPAMAAGLSETVMDWTDIVEAMDADAPATKRGLIKRQAKKFQTETLPFRHPPFRRASTDRQRSRGVARRVQRATPFGGASGEVASWATTCPYWQPRAQPFAVDKNRAGA
jgi:hypothetical protein